MAVAISLLALAAALYAVLVARDIRYRYLSLLDKLGELPHELPDPRLRTLDD